MEDLGIAHLSRRDIVIENIIEKIKKTPRVESTHDVFHDLLSCILDQQIHYRSKFNVVTKLTTFLNGVVPTAENLFTISDVQMASLKMSDAKYQTLLRLTEYWQENNLTHFDWSTLSDDAVRAKLSEIKGIGIWTMDMILLFTLERPNIFPADDYHLKNLMVQLYGLDPKSKLKSQMLEVAEGWSPYKSLAVKYILAWKDLHKKYKT